MLSNYLIAPSLIALVITSIFILAIFYIFILNFKDILRIPYYDKLILLSSMAVAIGMHGINHLGVETMYGFNPFTQLQI